MVTNGSKRTRRIAAGLLVAAGALLAGVGPVSGDGPRTNPRERTAESIRNGKAVFFEYCAGCHGRRADGRGLQALNLVPKPQNLRNAEFVAYLTDERMFGSISGGVRGTAMPPFEMILSETKRWDVMNYIRSLTDGDASGLPNSIAHEDVPAGTEDPFSGEPGGASKGRDLYMNYCISCHGVKADGNGKIATSLVPAPRNLVVVTSFGEKPFIDYLTDARLFDSITNGVPGTSMMPWIGVMSDRDRWSLIEYLRGRADEEREKGDRY